MICAFRFWGGGEKQKDERVGGKGEEKKEETEGLRVNSPSHQAKLPTEFVHRFACLERENAGQEHDNRLHLHARAGKRAVLNPGKSYALSASTFP